MNPDLQAELERCVRCGACTAVCPVFDVTHREEYVARGKIALIDKRRTTTAEQPLSRRYRQVLTSCLLCGSCTQSCPNAVDTKALVQAARAELARNNRDSWLKRTILRRILPRKWLMPTLARLARATRFLWARRLPPDSGLHIRLARGAGSRRRRIPRLIKPFYLDRAPPAAGGDEEAQADGAGMRVALFVGCVANFMRPGAAEGAHRALTRLGARVEVPRGQGCCGLAAYGSGEEDAARKLAARNLDVLLPEGGTWPDAVTTPCASCAAMLRDHLPGLLADDPARSRRAEELAARVVPFSTLWSRLAREHPEQHLQDPAAPDETGLPRLTYHDPCHLARGFGEKDAPRHLLKSLGCASFIEMPHPCKCCGHGGVFSLIHPEQSAAIAAKKVENIKKSGADQVVTECSGCLLQLEEALVRDGICKEVIYTAEAVDRYGQPDGQKKP